MRRRDSEGVSVSVCFENGKVLLRATGVEGDVELAMTPAQAAWRAALTRAAAAASGDGE